MAGRGPLSLSLGGGGVLWSCLPLFLFYLFLVLFCDRFGSFVLDVSQAFVRTKGGTGSPVRFWFHLII